MFLPSILEYSTTSLEKKLKAIATNTELFKTLTKTTNHQLLQLHLDFVLTQFAKDRSIMESLSLSAVFETLESFFKHTRLKLSVHIMGEFEDIINNFSFFQDCKFPKKWEIEIYVPEKYFIPWNKSYFSKSGGGKHSIGIWYDKSEWYQSGEKPELLGLDSLCNNFLLMTVTAGRSGQALLPEVKDSVIQTIQTMPTKNFILDGGWNIDEQGFLDNAKIVSYSSFWGKFIN